MQIVFKVSLPEKFGTRETDRDKISANNTVVFMTPSWKKVTEQQPDDNGDARISAWCMSIAHTHTNGSEFTS